MSSHGLEIVFKTLRLELKLDVGCRTAVERATCGKTSVKRPLWVEVRNVRRGPRIGDRDGVMDVRLACDKRIPEGAVCKLLIVNTEARGLRTLKDEVRHHVDGERIGHSGLIDGPGSIDDDISRGLDAFRPWHWSDRSSQSLHQDPNFKEVSPVIRQRWP